MEKKMTDKNQIIKEIRAGETSLGIEFGSTRIKAVLVGKEHAPIASGSYEWENQLVDSIWTYSLEDIWKGLQTSYQELAKDVKEQYGEILTKIGSMGFSAMMHGYMPFDEEDNLLVPFRTWRNNITEQATDVLTPLFGQQIPQRWSIAHLYQAILNGEEHVKDITFFTTLAGYIHWKLTGKKVLGVGDASGMFPIDSETVDYNQKMVEQFDELKKEKGYPWKLREILPQVLSAGEDAGTLTEEGAKLLDVSGNLQPGSLVCPPEGDAGTGMVATNSVKQRTGNVSAGTSVFAMIVLEKALSKPYKEIDMVTTPAGDAVAMAHSNNCTSDLNAWVNVFKEFAEAMGMEVDMNKLFGTLYNKALEGFDVVFAKRVERKDSALTMALSRAFYKVYEYFTDGSYDPSLCNFSIARRAVISQYCSMREHNRGYTMFIKWLGFRQTAIEIVGDERFAGESSYSFRKKLNMAFELITAQSNKPLKFAVNVGFAMSFVALLVLIAAIVQKICVPGIQVGWTSLLCSIFFMGGLILSAIGIVGLYVGNIFTEVKNRPLYVIEKECNGKDE